MDMKNCDICGKQFDFDKEGLSSEDNTICSVVCAKKCSANRGKRAVLNVSGIHVKLS